MSDRLEETQALPQGLVIIESGQVKQIHTSSGVENFALLREYLHEWGLDVEELIDDD